LKRPVLPRLVGVPDPTEVEKNQNGRNNAVDSSGAFYPTLRRKESSDES